MDTGDLSRRIEVGSAWDVDNPHRVTVTARTNNANASFDGVLGTPDTTVTIPSGLRWLRFGGRVASGFTWHGYIKQLVLYTRYDTSLL